MSRGRRGALVRTLAGALIAVLLVATPRTGAAQADPLQRALASYRDLDYDAAATSLRALLAVEGSGALSVRDRQRARTYLAASEVFRGRREAAIEQFRAILTDDASFRPDLLVFPPEVTTVFQAARSGLRVTNLRVPPTTRIASANDRLVVRVWAASSHDVRVAITDELGSAVRLLHEGPSGDSLVLEWNGRDGLGRFREPGTYTLRVTSRTSEGRDEREVEVPLRIERVAPDTLPLPEPPSSASMRPETAPASGGTRFLVTGLSGAAIVAAMPSVVGAESGGSSMRFGIAAAFAIAGTLGKVRAASPQPIPANIEWNRRQRDSWAREVTRVRAENEQRRAVQGVLIRAGTPVARESR